MDVTWPHKDTNFIFECRDTLSNHVMFCNWLIMLVTVATPVSSHVKDKNSIFTVCGEDMTFWRQEKSRYFISIYIIKRYSHARSGKCPGISLSHR